MKTIETYEVKVPGWALSYLVNADPSGLEDSEIEMIDQWWRKFEKIAEQSDNACAFFAIPTGATADCEPYYSRSPEFGLAGNVVDCEVQILIEEKSRFILTVSKGREWTYSIRLRHAFDKGWKGPQILIFNPTTMLLFPKECDEVLKRLGLDLKEAVEER